MELACIENFHPHHLGAPLDRTIYRDPRVIQNLLRDEIQYLPQCDYFRDVQDDVQPFMRKVVATWMLEVCEEQMCEDQVLPLAVNYMDRFLCTCRIKRQQLQLLGATCLLIASKLRSTTLLSIDLLCAYTDYSVTFEHIANWELLVLSKLHWNVSSITAFDYIDQIIERCSWGKANSLLRRHSHTLVSICCTETNLIRTAPSTTAAACICSALRGLKSPHTDDAITEVCHMINVEPITLEILIRIVDNVVERAVAKNNDDTSNCSASGSVRPEDVTTTGTVSLDEQPETPTDVENIFF